MVRRPRIQRRYLSGTNEPACFMIRCKFPYEIDGTVSFLLHRHHLTSAYFISFAECKNVSPWKIFTKPQLEARTFLNTNVQTAVDILDKCAHQSGFTGA